MQFYARNAMARREQDREDLFGEAAALVERAELEIAGYPEPVTAGRRRNGAWSIYFGGDPCFHFDDACRLRRAFAQEHLYRTQGHTLAQLDRIRTPDVTELRRYDLSPQELARFLEVAQARLSELHESLHTGAFRLRRLFPPDAAIVPKLDQALTLILHPALRLAPAFKSRT